MRGGVFPQTIEDIVLAVPCAQPSAARDQGAPIVLAAA
jgi:hypothetical protein